MGNHVLIVDDEVGIRELLTEILEDEGYTVTSAAGAGEARSIRNRMRPDLVLLDIWMPECDGITLLKEWATNGQLTMPVVMMSGHATIETAVEATRIGAYDFMEKPIALQKLLTMVARAIKSGVPQTKTEAVGLTALGKSQKIQQLKQQLEQVSRIRGPILLTGETGVGFEACARIIHLPNTPWVVADPEQMAAHPLEVMRQASNGLLFIRELAQCGGRALTAFRQIVAAQERQNIRLVCATTHPLSELARDTQFDNGLLQQIAQLTIPVPPLREHSDDVVDLANQMLTQLIESRKIPPRRFSTGALNALKNDPWPGNIEQLQNVVNTVAITATQEEIDLAIINRVLAQYRSEPNESGTMPGISFDIPLREARDIFERMYFEYQIRQENGNMSRVAEKAGLERTHLYRKLKQLGLKPGRRTE